MIDDRSKTDYPKCALCGIEGLPQPALKSKIMTAYVIPLGKGGSQSEKNKVPLCRFHEKIYTRWGTAQERGIAAMAIRDYMKQRYDGWTTEDCFKRV